MEPTAQGNELTMQSPNNQTHKIINLQSLDLRQVYKDLDIKGTLENNRVLEWHDASLLTDVTQFAELLDKIFNHIKSNKKHVRGCLNRGSQD